MNRRCSAPLPLVSVFLASVLLVMTSRSAQAADIHWTNASGGTWNTAANWNSGAGPVPGSSDNAIIDAAGSYTVTVNANVMVTSFTLGAASGTQTLAAVSHTIKTSGASVILSTGVMNLTSSSVTGPGSLNNQGTFIGRGNTSINCRFITDALSLTRVEGINGPGNGTLTVASGFTNDGTIELTSTGGTLGSVLNVTAGTLTNAAGANLNVLAGAGGARTIGAQLDNQGTLTVSQPLLISKSSAIHTNSGTIDLSGQSLTLTQSGTTPSFTTTGTITIGLGRTLSVNGGTFTNAAGGTLQGTGTLDVANSTFSNGGNINPGASPGILSITGAAPFVSSSALNLEIGGPVAGTDFDRLAVTGAATLDGALHATLINGFTPALGDSFLVVTAGSRDGQFSSQNLPSLGGGLEFRVGYRPTSVVLTVVNPAAPTVAINSVSVAEGDSGTTNAVFTVTLSAPDSQTVTVDYSTTDGTATAPADYASTSGTVTFPPSSTSQQIAVPVEGDLLDEPDETFFVNLSNPTNTTIATGQGVGTIIDDDPTPTLSINDVTVTEGNSGTVNADFTVSLSAPSGRTVTVNYATADGTANAPADYTARNGTLTFPAGTTTQPVTVTVNGDVLDEADETFFVNLTTPTNATIADNQGQGTIIDDDPPPSISINHVSVTEGNSGTVNATFSVTLSTASGKTVTVDYSTADSTATQPSDYTAKAGTVTFPPGITSESVTVLVQGDLVVEPDEAFLVNLTNPVNATIADGQGVGTITNDDFVGGVLAINDVTVKEGDAGTTNAVFTVTLTPSSSQTVTVNYATADSTAVSPADYVAGSGTLTFAPGVTSQTVTVAVNGDLFYESNETFHVNLSNPVNATIGAGQGVGTITNDDSPPTISINDVSVTEGNSGTVNAVFHVTLSSASGISATVNYATADNTAIAPGDYTATSGTLTFTPGTTNLTVTVPVIGDLLDEPDQTFFVNLTAPTNATIADNQGVGTIIDDDPPPSISINDVAVTEGNSGTVNATFSVTLSAPSGKSVTVDYGTADGTATQPSDYTATSGTVTFPPGTTSQSITVLVQGDLLTEANETFFVNLTNPTNGTIADGQGTGTIINDDNVSSVLSIGNVTVTEGNAGTTNAVFTVTLAPSSGQTVTVNYATADGTAASPADYATGSGTLTFAPGVTSQTVTVAVNGDLLYEPNETFYVNLSNPANATIGTGQGIGTITNDDSPPTISIDDVTVTEGNAGTVNAVFTVSLSQASGVAATVNYATANNTAIAPGDYTAASGTLTFPGGTTTQAVTVAVKGDLLDEPDETYFVNLTSPTGATISDNQGLGTITNDDTPPAISIHDVSVPEGNTGYVFANFQVTLSSASGRTVTVDFATADNTATSPSDYTAGSGTVTFPPGTTSQTIVVSVIPDTVVEPDETFFVNLTNPVNATIAVAQGEGTIVNDDAVVPIAPVTAGYWRQHPSLIAQYLPIHLGQLTVATGAQAGLVFEFGDGIDWNNRLRAELLAALLNLANGSANAACVQPTVDDAQTFLDANGSKRLITKKYKDLIADANHLMLDLRAYNGGYAPCFPGAAVLAEQQAPDEGTSVSLEPNYPNPFNGFTTIEYGLPVAAHVRLVVYDVHGREVKVLVDEDQGPGDYSTNWNGTDRSSAPVGSGVYYYRITAGGSEQLGKMIFVK